MKVQERHVVVLVEDDEDDEYLSIRGVDRSGVICDLTVLRHGGEALVYLLDPIRSAPDLVVLDYHLPGLTGLQILRGLREVERTRRVPVVILSSEMKGPSLIECYLNGANSCVEKPSDPDLYLDRVKMIIRYWLDVNEPSTR